MTDFDRKDYEAHLQDRLRERRKEREPELRRAVQAATAMEQMTGSPEWDYFLSRVEALRQEAEEERKRALEHLEDPSIVSDESIRKARVTGAMARAAIVALDKVLEIPKQALEDGKRAKRVLDA